MRTLLAASILLLLISGCTFQSRVIQVTLVNNGQHEARNIEFRYPGGSFGVASLAPGKTYEYRADKNQVRAYQFKGKNYRV